MLENKYCKCGEPINIETGNKRFRKDGIRYFSPYKTDLNYSLFRCPKCHDVVDKEKLLELGEL